jgi:hypothetical protein
MLTRKSASSVDGAYDRGFRERPQREGRSGVAVGIPGLTELPAAIKQIHSRLLPSTVPAVVKVGVVGWCSFCLSVARFLVFHQSLEPVRSALCCEAREPEPMLRLRS